MVQVGDPIKAQREQSVLDIRKNTIVKNLSNLQHRKYPKHQKTQIFEKKVEFFLEKFHSNEKPKRRSSKFAKPFFSKSKTFFKSEGVRL